MNDQIENYLEQMQFKMDTNMIEEVLDTRDLQFIILQKYLNTVGIFLVDGLFRDAVDNWSIVSLNRAVSIYNHSVANFVKRLHNIGVDPGVMIRKVKLQGRSPRRGVHCTDHKIKFIRD